MHAVQGAQRVWILWWTATDIKNNKQEWRKQRFHCFMKMSAEVGEEPLCLSVYGHINCSACSASICIQPCHISYSGQCLKREASQVSLCGWFMIFIYLFFSICKPKLRRQRLQRCASGEEWGGRRDLLFGALMCNRIFLFFFFSLKVTKNKKEGW